METPKAPSSPPPPSKPHSHDFFMGNFRKDENVVPDEQRYNDIMKDVKDVQAEISSLDGEIEELIVICSFLSDAIEAEILAIFKFIRHKYPDLESSVSDPIEYARAVKRVGGEEPLQKAIDSCCDRAISLDEGKKRLQNFVATRITSIAPNLAAIVGISVAANLVVEAGGLQPLTKMSSGDFQLLGFKRMISTGFSSRVPEWVGYLADTDIYRSTPALIRKRVGWLLAMSAAAAVDVDYRKLSRTGEMGWSLRSQVWARVEKLKKIGGRRLRKEMNKKMSFRSVKLGLKAAAGKFKKQRGGASSGSVVAAQELASQFGEMALATQTTTFSPNIEFSKMSI